MSITTLLSNVPNLVKVLSLSAAVGTGGVVALQNAPMSPMDTTPIVSSTPTVSAEALESLIPEEHLELAESNELMEAMSTATDEVEETEEVEEATEDEKAERGPGHATGLDRAEERANEHASNGHARARAAHAAAAARRAERGEPGSRGSAEARTERAAERAERAESRGGDAPGRAIAASKREGRGRH